MPRVASKQGPLLKLGAALFFALAGGCAAPTLRLAQPGPVGNGSSRWRGPSGVEGADDGPPLRVLLKLGGGGLKASAPGGLRLCSPDGDSLAEIPADGRARLQAEDGRIVVNGRTLDASQAQILPLRRGDWVSIAGRRYRGRLLLEAGENELALVNVVGLEDYLRGVLPCEVASAGPPQALMAQAVAARSFALTQMQGSAAKAWDLDNSADSQVYGSMNAERGATDAAVRATRGEVLTFNGAVAHTYFFSNSGGFTASSSEVWAGLSPPYLQGVMDTWSEDEKHYRWTASLPLSEAGSLLEKAGLWEGTLEGVEPRGLSESERWTKVDLLGGGGRRVTVSANAFRRAVGADRVRSTHFTVEIRDKSLVFKGLGWGHGVGLAQEGAFAMAKSGWDYREILRFYYPGTSLALLKE
jgi:stage II sporulation protein D